MAALYQTEFDRVNGISSIVETYGGSETTQLFIHCHASLENIERLESIVTGLEKYPERSLVLARPNDLVCVLDGVDNRFLQFLNRLSVGPKPENVIGVSKQDGNGHLSGLANSLKKDRRALAILRDRTKQSKKIFLNPFVLSSSEFELAEVLAKELDTNVRVLGENSGIVDHAGYKHHVKKKAMELGIPVPEGDVVKLQKERNGKPSDLKPVVAAIHRYLAHTGKVIVKGSSGYSGCSTYIVDDNSESIPSVLNQISQSNDNNIYLIEPMFDVIVSPNILMYVEANHGNILCVGITDQILSESLAHQGNIYPSAARRLAEMLDSSLKISKWLQADGYCGLLGLDFAEYVHSQTGKVEYFLAEVNPRMNAAAYSKSLMEHLNNVQYQNDFPFMNAFVSINIETKVTSFAELSELCGHLFFRPQTAQGLVPYNTGCLKYGKFTAAIFGRTSDEVTKIHESLTTILTEEPR